MGIIGKVSNFSERWSETREPLTNGVLSAHAGKAKLTARCGDKSIEIGFEEYERQVHVRYFRINDMEMEFRFMPNLERWEAEFLGAFFPLVPCSRAEDPIDTVSISIPTSGVTGATFDVKCSCGQTTQLRLEAKKG